MSEIFTNWPENDFRYYLAHHGILKQRWGVRHGPPYPLDYNAHTKAQQKANISKHNIGQKKYSKSEGKHFSEIARFSDSRPAFMDKVDLYNREAFGSFGKYVGETSKYLAEQVKQGRNPFPRRKGFDGIFDEVNPNYGEPGTTNNCPFVGAAMEIRSRGFDVVARRSQSGTSAACFEGWFKGAKNEYCASWRQMKDEIRAMGDGASGVFQGFYGDGLGSGHGGHTLHWRNEGGKTIVADGQCHKEMPFADVLSEYHFNPGACINTRLDNCEINWDWIAADGVVGIDAGYGTKHEYETRAWHRRDQDKIYEKY